MRLTFHRRLHVCTHTHTRTHARRFEHISDRAFNTIVVKCVRPGALVRFTIAVAMVATVATATPHASTCEHVSTTLFCCCCLHINCAATCARQRHDISCMKMAYARASPTLPPTPRAQIGTRKLSPIFICPSPRLWCTCACACACAGAIFQKARRCERTSFVAWRPRRIRCYISISVLQPLERIRRTCTHTQQQKMHRELKNNSYRLPHTHATRRRQRRRRRRRQRWHV